METGFLNFHDEEHFSTSICEQSSGFENDSSLFGANEYLDSFVLPWDQKFNVNQLKVEPNCNEDYEKTLNAWNQHLKELDNSIKCEGGLFLSGIDDPVCFSTGISGDDQEPVSQSDIDKTCDDLFISPHNLNKITTESSTVIKAEPEDAKSVPSRITSPALEAGDLKTLLEQFEAASKPPTPKKVKKLKSSNMKTSPTIVHKSIKDALPKEVIDRIRESCKRRKEASSGSNAVTTTVPVKTFSCISSPPKIVTVTATVPLEREGDNESSSLLRLEHNYCYRGGSTLEMMKEDSGSDGHHNAMLPDYSASRKDSGLESGELTDSSSIGSPSQPHTSLQPNLTLVKQEVEEVDESSLKKKKKLKLEEYWERRKNMKPSSQDPHLYQVKIKSEPSEEPMFSIKVKNEPCEEAQTCSSLSESVQCVSSTSEIQEHKHNRTSSSQLPKEQDNKLSPKPTMVSVEVQTAEVEVKKEEKQPIDEELQKKKEMWLETMRSTYRPRYSSSSSSSSYETKSYSRKRGRASRRYRRRCDSSYSRSRSRSRSRSSSSSSSSSVYSGKSRSKSRRRRRSFSRNRSRKYSSSNGSRSRRTRDDWSPFEKQKQVEERRVIYVGQIEDGISKQRLRDRFHKFGHIVDISLHFRERGDNYGFVTFKYPDDAYQAVEHGNDYGLEPKYDICFGGRRAFCKQRYSDLDSVGSTAPHYSSFPNSNPIRSSGCNSFDLLLREAQENLRKRSAV